MRPVFRPLGLLVAPLLLVAGPAGPAHADLYLEGHPDAKQSSCLARFDGDQASCTITAIGKHFAVGITGSSGVVRVVLEAPSHLPGLPPEEIAACQVAGALSGCVGATGYLTPPFPVGTALTCRAYGIGSGSFECASFLVEER